MPATIQPFDYAKFQADVAAGKIPRAGAAPQSIPVKIADIPTHLVPADTVSRKFDTKTIQQRFEEFHRDNPYVYNKLVEFARIAKAKGYERIGIGFLCEIIRWQGGPTISKDGFKISNDFRSRYSRLIEENEPDLNGFFTKRNLEAA
jgi:hypothetical protein